MKILIVGVNYDPEPTGIAVYTTGLARGLARMGHEVTVICAPPHYPSWRLSLGYSAIRYARETDHGVRLIRCPIYVPGRPTGARRMLHYASFALSSLLPTLRLSRSIKPDLVFTIAPSLLSVPGARLAAAAAGAKSWLHIQDFEVEAAVATGLMKQDSVAARMARIFETWILRRFDRVSAISPQMCRKLAEKQVARERITEFRNWSDVAAIRPLDRPSCYRELWSIATPHVALYSGSIGNKQGIEIILDAARSLQGRRDLTFVICGEGPNRQRLEALATGLDNVQFRDLQPFARLNDLMNLATIHLLPQIEDAADLVLPSKLTNMLASGRPVVATASAGTGLYDEIVGRGIATPPGDARAFADAVEELASRPEYRAALGRAASGYAQACLAVDAILLRVEGEMLALTGSAGNAVGWADWQITKAA